MKRLLLSCALAAILAGCSSKTQEVAKDGHVDPSRLVSAQGKMEPGVVVYDEDGYVWARVIRVEPSHTFPSGVQGGVYLNWGDDPKGDYGYAPFAMLDKKFVAP